MVRDKLKKALEDAVGHYNDGMSANDAIVKSASDNDLTVDQTDRVVESFNTAKTINYFDKNASDRTGKFDLASKKDVTLALFGNTPNETKSASVSDPDGVMSSFYYSSPDKSMNRKSVFSEKRSAFLDMLAKAAEERWKHGYSDRTLHDMASDSFSTIKSAQDDINAAIGTIDDYLWTATEKIASEIESDITGSPEDKADMFKVACPHKSVIDEVSKFSPLLKRASGGKYVKMHVVDTAPVDSLLKEADEIVKAVEMRRDYRNKHAEFERRKATLKEAMMKDPSMSDIPVKNAVSDMIHAPRMGKVATSLPTYKTVNEVLNDAMAAGGDSRKKINEQIRDEARGALISDLLSSDPILQDADPRQVASIYKSLIATSPRVSLNKEIVRSILRSAVNSVAVSPADSKIFTDVDKGIQVAYGGLGSKDE